MKTTQISFSAGEISPEMQGRIDARQYQYGLETCSNFIIRPQGVADRRVGMQHLGSAMAGSTGFPTAEHTRLVAFQFSDKESYALELCNFTGRIWKDGELVKWATPRGNYISSSSPAGTGNNTLTTLEKHGLRTGDQVQLIPDSNTTTYQTTPGTAYSVTVADAKTFSLDGVTITDTFAGVCRVYLDSEVPDEYVGGATTVTASTGAVNGAFSVASHPFKKGDRVRWGASSALPTAFSSSVDYFVIAQSAQLLQLGLTPDDEDPITWKETSTRTLQGRELYRRYMEGELVLWDGSAGAIHGVYRATGRRTATAVNVETALWGKMPGDGVYFFDHPYADEELLELTYTQSNDVVTIAHPNHRPREIIRYGLTTWESIPVSFEPPVATPTLLSNSVSSRGQRLLIVEENDEPNVPVRANEWEAAYFVGYTEPNWTNPLNTGAVVVRGDTLYIEYVSGTFENFNSDGSDDGYYYVYNASDASGRRKLKLRKQDGTALTVTSQNASTGVLNAYRTSDSASLEQNYKVTALDSNGSESVPQDDPVTFDNNLESSGSSNTIRWLPVAGAVRYRVYRERSGLYGLIGETEEIEYKDDNEQSEDMSVTPPILDDELDGTYGYPRAVSYFEQRRLFAGTDYNPRTLYMTRPGTESDLTYSLPLQDTNRVSATLTAREAAVIKHIVPMQDLLLLTQQGEWRLFTINSDAIGPETIAIRQQSAIGANGVQPLAINNVVVYAAARGGHIRQLSFNFNQQGYLTGDLSLRATHLFDNFQLTDAAYQQAPYPIMWWLSDSGKLLGCTYIPEEELSAWHQHSSDGATFDSICVVPEGRYDTVYVVVNRNGTRTIERMVPDLNLDLETAVYADSAVSRDGYADTFTMGGTFTFAEAASYRAGSTIRITITEPVLEPFDAGGFLRWKHDGVEYSATLSSIVSGTVADVTLDQDLPPAASDATVSAWALATKTVGGMSHLEGLDVQVVADGVYIGTKTVSNGQIELDSPAARVVAGVGYDSDLKTLPQAYQVQGFGQGTTKNVRDVWMRVLDTAGLEVGPSEGELSKVDTLTNKELQTGEYETAVPSEWTQSGQMLVRQSAPRPATILNLTMLTEIGD